MRRVQCVTGCTGFVASAGAQRNVIHRGRFVRLQVLLTGMSSAAPHPQAVVGAAHAQRCVRVVQGSAEGITRRLQVAQQPLLWAVCCVQRHRKGRQRGILQHTITIVPFAQSVCHARWLGVSPRSTWCPRLPASRRHTPSVKHSSSPVEGHLALQAVERKLHIAQRLGARGRWGPRLPEPQQRRQEPPAQQLRSLASDPSNRACEWRISAEWWLDAGIGLAAAPTSTAA